MIGETISHYRILRHLGRGGMGVVYEAQDVTLGRKVAIKFLAETSEKSSDAVKRLQREARVLSALNHPNICTVYELGEHQGRPYLVEELLVGVTFREVIERRKLAPEFVLELATQIADGLKVAHARGLVHRDIKPPNLFLTEDNRAKILDFGLARQSKSTVSTSGETSTLEADQNPPPYAFVCRSLDSPDTEKATKFAVVGTGHGGMQTGRTAVLDAEDQSAVRTCSYAGQPESFRERPLGQTRRLEWAPCLPEQSGSSNRESWSPAAWLDRMDG